MGVNIEAFKDKAAFQILFGKSTVIRILKRIQWAGSKHQAGCTVLVRIRSYCLGGTGIRCHCFMCSRTSDQEGCETSAWRSGQG